MHRLRFIKKILILLNMIMIILLTNIIALVQSSMLLTNIGILMMNIDHLKIGQIFMALFYQEVIFQISNKVIQYLRKLSLNVFVIY